MRIPSRSLLLVLLLIAAVPTPALRELRAEGDFPEEVPVAVRAEIDDGDLATLGRWRLRLTYQPLEDVSRPYRIELQLTRRGRVLVDLTHAPDPPTPRWRKGEPVTYELDVPVPIEPVLEPGTKLDLTLGFYDPELEALVPPRTDADLWGRRLPLARLEVPEPPSADDPAHVQAVIDRARDLASSSRKADAWAALELGLRQAREDATKRTYRDALLALAPYETRPPSILEQEIVKGRIADERRRWLRLCSSRHYRDGKLYAALRLLEEVGGTLQEDVDAAVIGALAEAKRTERDIVEIQQRILGTASGEDEEDAAAAIERYGATKRLLEQGEAWAKKERYAPARIAFRHIGTAGKGDLSAEARRLQDQVEAAWLAATPPDEAALVEEAKHHPAFERLAVSASQRFLFIGPRTLVEEIPENSRLGFDLAYVFLTDLFGRLPNPAGDRITVYFKELWDFGGGQGGGKRIDIGRAEPDRRGYRVDTPLLYHELVHCIDDTSPIYEGFREGLADFGAVYALQALEQKSGEFHALDRSLRAFREDYLARDIPYWRIQNYAVSAGFFLHFAEKYAKTADGHDWKPYRQFFREYRDAPVRDGRERGVARALAYYLVRAFGAEAFDDLIRFRFPLAESDRDIVGREIEVFERGEHRVPHFADEFEGHPTSPLPRDLGFREALERLGRMRDAKAARRIAQDRLGVIFDWRVIGPFAASGTDPRAYVFPPEYEIDFDKSYPNALNTCKWWTVAPEGVVSVSPTGWVSFGFSYMDQTATYALTHVTVPAAQTGHVHVRANDDLALFVNDRRVGDYVGRPETSTPSVNWRGAQAGAPDAQRFEVPLHEGRNKILLKVKNRWGTAGFTLALSRPDGRPIEGLAVDLDPPAPRSEIGDVHWRNVVAHDFRSKSYKRKLEPALGEWKVHRKRLEGRATDGRVPWRKYTVRPGFPKDSPSNLLWFHEKYTEELEDFRLRLDLDSEGNRAPKLAVTFQGEGGTDVLAGWTLILHPQGKEAVRARLERHEFLVYLSPDLPVSEHVEDETLPLTLTCVDDRLTVTLGDAILLKDASVRRIPGRYRIGVATWGPGTKLAGFELERPRRPGER